MLWKNRDTELGHVAPFQRVRGHMGCGLSRSHTAPFRGDDKSQKTNSKFRNFFPFHLLSLLFIEADLPGSQSVITKICYLLFVICHHREAVWWHRKS
jgi:hypothetical protein